MAAGLGGGALTQGGNIYTPTWVPGGTTEANDGGYTFAGYNAIPEGWKFGDMAQQYDAQGNHTGEWATSAPDLWDKLGPGLAMSLIGYAGLQGLMGGMGFGDAGAGGLDVASGGSGGVGGGFLNGFEAGVPTAAEVAASNAAFAETLAPYADTSLQPGISNKTLGAGLTAAGALAGSQGTPGQTSERKMDPRLDNYVFGQNGVVPMAAGLLSQQMPMAQQGGQQAFDFGRGLLGRGVASNPFMR